MPSKSTKPELQRAKELSNSTVLEEGDHWFAVATPWWEEFQGCLNPKDTPSVRNDSLIDKQLSSKVRKVSVLKPKLEEGSDFVFVPETSWEAIARELGCDWEICREVIYQRSQQQLQIEPYPFAFKMFYWTSNETEPQELVDSLGRAVIVLGSRSHTLGQLLSEVRLAAPNTFRQKFPQFLSGIDPTSSSPTSSKGPQLRACYHTVRACDSEMVWTPIDKMLKRPRSTPTLQLEPRAKKRQARDKDEESSDEQQSDEDEEESDNGSEQPKSNSTELSEMMDVKLGDLRLNNRSEVASGEAGLHELLVEQKSQNANEDWPSQHQEWQWRMGLAKGDRLDALDTSRTWFEARILASRRNKVHVHYRSWESKWDEWIPRTSPRIAPPHSHVSRWRSALHPDSLVQVGLHVPRLRHARWRTATVIEVAPSTEDKQQNGPDQAQGVGDGVGLRVHVQVDEDDMWLPAHDDMLCRPNTHTESKALTNKERRLLAHDDSMASDSSEAAEEPTAETKDGEAQGQEEVEEHGVEVGEHDVDNDDDDGEDDDDTVNLMEHERSNSPPVRPPRATNAAVKATSTSRARMDLRARVGPARNLTASFSQVEESVVSSAGRTPARGRGRRRSQVQVSSDDTSPEPVSPTAQPNIGEPSNRELRALWAQVGNDLRALQSSWEQLGEGLAGLMDAVERAASRP